MKLVRLIPLVLALCAGSAFAQLTYSSDSVGIAAFNSMKTDAPFVSATLLNIGSVTSFVHGGLTFTLIPNLDPTSPSDIQAAPGLPVDVEALASSHSDNDNFGSESSLLGAGNLVLYPAFGPSSTLTWHINALAATDVDFWMQDTTTTGATKFDMSDALAFRTYESVDVATNSIFDMFFIDDRRTSLVDFNDMVVGVRQNINPVGVIDAIPEPSTYGLIGAVALLGLISFRRVRRHAA